MSYCFFSSILNPKNSSLCAFHYVDQKRKVNYGNLADRAGIVQQSLRRSGVKKGDYVVVALEREEDILISLLAIASLGAITVPINPFITSYELKKISSVIAIKFIVTYFNFLQANSYELQNLQSLQAILTMGEETYELSPIMLSIHTKLGAEDRKEKLRIPHPSEVITCHFTMKGFDMALGVEHTYENYMLSLKSAHQIFNFQKGRKILSLLPVYPIFGLVTNLFYPMLKSCELIVRDKKFSEILKAIETYQIEHINVVPLVLEKMLLEAAKRENPVNLSHLVIVTGGSYLTPELHTKFRSTFGQSPVQGYGLTETLPIMSNHPANNKIGTLGTLMRPEVTMKIMDARGFEVPDGKAGEICFRGPGIIEKYLGGEEVHSHLFRRGWLRTGDLAYLDEDKHVVFLGRRLNFTKISGNMVDLTEIEKLALNLHGVKNSRAYLVTDNGKERLALALFVTRDFTFSSKEIIQYFRENLSSYKVPSKLKIYKSSYNEYTG